MGGAADFFGLPIVDTGHVPQIFAHDLGRVEAYGPWATTIWYVPQQLDGFTYEHIMQLRLILPSTLLAPIGKRLVACSRITTTGEHWPHNHHGVQ